MRWNPRRGANHPRAKLSEAQVAHIRASPGVSLRALARLLNVSHVHVRRIRVGESWASTEGTSDVPPAG